jgi:CheY-like chemotaxis protein
VQHVTARILSQAGYFLLCGHDGLQALEVSRHYPGRIHLLLTDLQMPNLNGLELIRFVREERPDTPAMIMSGHPFWEMAADIPFIQKPFTPAALKERVSGIIATSSHPGCLES